MGMLTRVENKEGLGEEEKMVWVSDTVLQIADRQVCNVLLALSKFATHLLLNLLYLVP